MNVFVYGTLMADQVVHAVVQKVYETAPACVRGYRRVCLKDRVYPGIIPTKDSSMLHGRLLRGVSKADLKILDWFEEEYNRVEEEILLEDGSRATAYIYVWASGQDEIIEKEWDYDAWRREAQVNGSINMESLF